MPRELRTNSHRRIADCGECHRQETNRLLENVEVLQTGEDGGRVELVTAQTVRDEGDYIGDVRISSQLQGEVNRWGRKQAEVEEEKRHSGRKNKLLGRVECSWRGLGR